MRRGKGVGSLLTSGLQHIHLEDLRADCIPLPSLAEQRRIVAEVERRLSVVEELEAVVNANLQRATRLRQSILQRAFSGGLLDHEDRVAAHDDKTQCVG